MNLISWNIRGLNGSIKQRLLRDRIIVEQPNILFLQETKCVGEETNQILSRCWKQGKMMHIDEIG
jgi:exonuclease III